ncbi:MAG: zinc ABC transporter substrate-binding protein [Phycisphaerales bacterium]|nr:MAG: zinc ABC transporter substrate-binding protein [Phycisphaerales bacterium]
MYRRTWSSFVAFGLAVWLLAVPFSCRQEKPRAGTKEAGEAPLRIFVSIPPQRYFVKRVGGDLVEVSVLVPPGQSPHTYELTPKQMVSLSEAHVFFRTGIPFEKQLVGKIGATLKGLNIVDTRKGIEMRAMSEHHRHNDEHDKSDQSVGHIHENDELGRHREPDHEHALTEEHPESKAPSHEQEHTEIGKAEHGHELGAAHANADQDAHGPDELDPHVWLSPRVVKVQARTICDELRRLDPANEARYEENCRLFHEELDRIDAQIAEALAPLKGREFFVFHPAFGYFADAYGLRQVAVQAGGKDPNVRQLGTLIERAKRDGVKLIFVQPQFSRGSAEAVARQIGGVVVPMDPLAEDYLENLLDMASKIKMALAGTRANNAGAR